MQVASTVAVANPATTMTSPPLSSPPVPAAAESANGCSVTSRAIEGESAGDGVGSSELGDLVDPDVDDEVGLPLGTMVGIAVGGELVGAGVRVRVGSCVS